MNSKDRLLPSSGAKRWGHRSTKSASRMNKTLHNGGYFEYREKIERSYLMKGAKKPMPKMPKSGGKKGC